MEEPGRLQFMGWQRVGHNLATSLYTAFKGLPCWLSGKEPTCQLRRHRVDPWVGKIPWRRKLQPTPVFLPGKSNGQRRLVGHSPWGCRVTRDWVTKQQQCAFSWVELLTHRPVVRHWELLAFGAGSLLVVGAACAPWHAWQGPRAPRTNASSSPSPWFRPLTVSKWPPITPLVEKSWSTWCSKKLHFKYTKDGLPWWSRGWDSVLPMQGAPGSIPGQGTRLHMLQLRPCATKETDVKHTQRNFHCMTLGYHLFPTWQILFELIHADFKGGLWTYFSILKKVHNNNKNSS